MNRKEFMIFCHRQEEIYLKKHPGTHLSKAQENKICVNTWNKYEHNGHI